MLKEGRKKRKRERRQRERQAENNDKGKKGDFVGQTCTLIFI